MREKEGMAGKEPWDNRKGGVGLGVQSRQRFHKSSSRGRNRAAEPNRQKVWFKSPTSCPLLPLGYSYTDIQHSHHRLYHRHHSWADQRHFGPPAKRRVYNFGRVGMIYLSDDNFRKSLT